MPHLVLSGWLAPAELLAGLEPEVWRWGRAVLKVETWWQRRDGGAALVQGVVVEHARPLHPVALLEPRDHGSIVHLWRLAPVERTLAVQRWLALLAERLCRSGAGEVVSTNLAAEVLGDLELGRPTGPGRRA